MTYGVPSVPNDYDFMLIFWSVDWEGKNGRHKSTMKEMYLEIVHKCPLLPINEKVMARVGICCGYGPQALSVICLGRWYV